MAKRVTFSLAVTLSTSTSYAASREAMAFFIMITGSGQESPLASIVFIFHLSSHLRVRFAECVCYGDHSHHDDPDDNRNLSVGGGTVCRSCKSEIMRKSSSHHQAQHCHR